MPKKGNLASALEAAAGKSSSSPEEAAREVKDSGEKRPYVQPSRKGKKNITGYFDPAVSRELKHIAADEDSTVQDLLAEAINDLLVKRGRNPIA